LRDSLERVSLPDRDRLPGVPSRLALPSVARWRPRAAEGRWPFPPCTDARPRGDPRGAPEHDRSWHRTEALLHRDPTFWTIRPAPPSETPAASIRPCRAPAVSSRRLSRTPLLGFVKDAPPSTSPGESTPGPAVARPSAHRMPSAAHVPPVSFHPTPAVSSSHGFAGLLHPAADHGVRRVSITRVQQAVRDGCAISSTAHALRSLSPASQPWRVTAPDCPPAVAPGARRFRRLRSPDLRALLRVRSRCERSPVARRVLHVASLGFSFRRVSGPTSRHSIEECGLAAFGTPSAGDLSFTPVKPGPAATVADGADRLRDAEPACTKDPETSSEPAGHAEGADSSLAPTRDCSLSERAGHPPALALLWATTRRRSTRAKDRALRPDPYRCRCLAMLPWLGTCLSSTPRGAEPSTTSRWWDTWLRPALGTPCGVGQRATHLQSTPDPHDVGEPTRTVQARPRGQVAVESMRHLSTRHTVTGATSTRVVVGPCGPMLADTASPTANRRFVCDSRAHHSTRPTG
jgi:hypothetical protein